MDKKYLKKFQKLKKDPKFPKLVYAEIHPTDLCNLKCYFCNQAVYRKSRFSELPWDLLIRTLNEMRELGLSRLRLSGGGEPTLYPEFLRIIEFVDLHDIVLWNLTTNGLLLEGEILDALSSVRWQHTLISLSAHEEADWMRTTGGSRQEYRRVIKNVKGLIEQRNTLRSRFPLVSLMLGIDKMTYKKLTGAYDFACDLGVDGILIKTYNNIVIPKSVQKNPSLILDQLREICAKNEKTKKIKYLGMTLTDLHLNAQAKKEVIDSSLKSSAYILDDASNVCLMPWYGTGIRANGDVIPCCSGIAGHSRLGNVHSSSMIDIWHGDEYRKLRDKFESIMHPFEKTKKAVELPQKCIASGDLDVGCPVKIGWGEFFDGYENG